MPVPLVDLKRQNDLVADEIQAGWHRLINECQFVLGTEVMKFEAAFARFSSVRHCVGVANGTDALELSLRAIGVGPGDEIVVPVNSFIASALAVLRAGATPVLVDVNSASYLLDLEAVGACLSVRTKAVMPVHLYGQVAPPAPLQEVVGGGDIAIVQDAAQAHGARSGASSVGAFTIVTATSFYPAKNLGAFGDAGAVLTDSDDVSRSVRALRNYGGVSKYDHPSMGFNSRLDEIQAVVLTAKLAHLETWNEQRRVAATRYDGMLSELERVQRPGTVPGNDHVWHLYVVRVPERDRVLAALNDVGVGAAVHYPVPLHLQGALRHLGYGVGDFPVAEQVSKEVLSLPIFPGITCQEQEEVVEQLEKCLR